MNAQYVPAEERLFKEEQVLIEAHEHTQVHYACRECGAYVSFGRHFQHYRWHMKIQTDFIVPE